MSSTTSLFIDVAIHLSARSYVDMGIKLLEPSHWEEQYTLSLDLFEMSASISFVFGDTTKASSSLDIILTHSKSFEDSLNASVMLAKLLASLSKHDEAVHNLIAILARLGETLPPQLNPAIIQSKLSEIKPLLLTLTIDHITSLPAMVDKTRLQAMNILANLSAISSICTPLLLPVLSIRMVELTMQFGYCNDTIPGLFHMAFCLVRHIQCSNHAKIQVSLPHPNFFFTA